MAPQFPPVSGPAAGPPLSEELRFWWRDRLPADVRSWFDGLPLEERHKAERTDLYIVTGCDTLGIKQRGDAPAIKQLYGQEGADIKALAARRTIAWPDSDLIPEIWTRHVASALDLGGKAGIALRKQREIGLLPDHDAPGQAGAVQVELSRIETGAFHDSWWTLGLEVPLTAIAAASALEPTLRRHGLPRGISSAVKAGYPAWLAQRSAAGG